MLNTQKFHYLLSCVEGEASSSIPNLNIFNENYTIAWDILITRYDNNRIIIENHLKCLFQLNETKHENAKDLRHLQTEINKHIGALKALIEPVEHWNSILLYLIYFKFDNSTKKEWKS